jgi:AcrR family transcriptional regulator
MYVSCVQQACQLVAALNFVYFKVVTVPGFDPTAARTKKAVQSEATRTELLRAARELFTERGYADTFTDEVAERAGVTRGALYHHFPGKKDLFLAVFEDVERELAARVAAIALAERGSWEQLRAGAQAFLDVCLDPTAQRISLLDAPSVLGWETWRQIDGKYGFGLLKNGLRAAMEAGFLEAQPVEPLAHMLLGALNEAVMMIARAEDVPASRAQVGASVDALLNRLKTSPPANRQSNSYRPSSPSR